MAMKLQPEAVGKHISLRISRKWYLGVIVKLDTCRSMVMVSGMWPWDC